MQYIYIVCCCCFFTWIWDSPFYLAEEGIHHNNGVLSNPQNNMWHIKALNNMLGTVSVFHVSFPVSLQLKGTTPAKMPGPAWNSWSGRSKRMPRWRDDLRPCQFSHTMLRPGIIFDGQSVIEEETWVRYLGRINCDRVNAAVSMRGEERDGLTQRGGDLDG